MREIDNILLLTWQTKLDKNDASECSGKQKDLLGSGQHTAKSRQQSDQVAL